MIIDCHGHYTTAPKSLEAFRQKQIDSLKDARLAPVRDSLIIRDDEIREGIRLLAENEGIFAETAGGVTVGVAKKLIASGKIPANDSAVLCITGNGLKTLDAVVGHVGKTREIKPSLREFEAMLATEEKVST